MPINATEKGWVDGVDGIRTIGDIVEKTLPDTSKSLPLDRARAFFERLWLYDQIVVEMHGTTDNDTNLAIVD